VIDALPAAIYTTDAAGKDHVLQTKRQSSLWGFRPRALARQSFGGHGSSIISDGSENAARVKYPIARGARTETTLSQAWEAVAHAPGWGRAFPSSPTPPPLFDAAGVLVGAVNMVVDISRKENARKAQQARAASVQPIGFYRAESRQAVYCRGS